MGRLRIIQWNCAGITYEKLLAMKQMIDLYKPDVICL